MRWLVLLVVAGCATTLAPPRKPYTELQKDPPCSQPIAQSDFRHVRPFRNYVEIRSVAPLEHHFVALWSRVGASGIANFAARHNPNTGELDVRSEYVWSGEYDGFEGPKLRPVPGELQPYVEEIKRRAPSEDLPKKPRSLEFGYTGEYRVVTLDEMMPLDPDGADTRLSVRDSLTLHADATLTHLVSGSNYFGNFYGALCGRDVCSCEYHRWVDGLPSSNRRGTILLSRFGSDPALEAQVLAAARRVDAGANTTTLAELLTKDPDTGLLPADLSQCLALDLTVVGRFKQRDPWTATPNDLVLSFDAREAVFGTARATTKTTIDGVEIRISADLSADSPPAQGRTEVVLTLVVRVEDGRGRSSEQRYRRRLDALVDGRNAAFTRYELSTDEKARADVRHVLPGGANTTEIDAIVGSLRPVLW